jgi:hypothetical protein
MFGREWREKYYELADRLLAAQAHERDGQGLSEDVLYCHRRVAHLLKVDVIQEARRPRPAVQAKGRLVLPPELCAEVSDSRTYADIPNRRVVVLKVVYRQWRGFHHRIFAGNRTRVVALMGRDETNQLWQHFLPDEFIDESLDKCERYLFQAEPGDEVIEA